MTDISSVSGGDAYASYLRTLFSKAAFAQRTENSSLSSSSVSSLPALSGSEGSGGAEGKGTRGSGLAELSDETLQALLQGLQSGGATSGANQTDFSDVVSAMDSDGDGVVTQEEFLAARPDDVTEEMATNPWNSLDTEGAGSLSVDELQTAMEANRPSGPPPTSVASSEEETDPLQALWDALSESEDETTIAETETDSSTTTTSALQELLEAIKSYQTTAGYENTKLVMSALLDNMA